jgi:ATP synthase protein I
MQMGAAYRGLGVQSVAIILGAAALFFWLGKDAAAAAFFGGAVALANAMFLVWCQRAGAQRPVQSARQELARLVRFSMERFFMVALLMVAGLGWLKLLPVPLLMGFALGQLTLIVSTIFSGIEK